MKIFFCFLLSVSAVLLVSSCKEKPPEKPVAVTENLETQQLASTIDAFVVDPSPAQAAKVDGAFAELDGEIAELDKRVTESSGAERTEAQAKAANLREYRTKEQARYLEARTKAKIETGKEDARELGEKIERSAEKAGDAVKDATLSVKEGAADAVDTVKDKLSGSDSR